MAAPPPAPRQTHPKGQILQGHRHDRIGVRHLVSLPIQDAHKGRLPTMAKDTRPLEGLSKGRVKILALLNREATTPPSWTPFPIEDHSPGGPTRIPITLCATLNPFGRLTANALQEDLKTVSKTQARNTARDLTTNITKKLKLHPITLIDILPEPTAASIRGYEIDYDTFYHLDFDEHPEEIQTFIQAWNKQAKETPLR